MHRLTSSTRTCAESSCGKLWPVGIPTSQLHSRPFSPPRTIHPARAHSSWESSSQLPWFQRAPLRGLSQIQVGNAAHAMGRPNFDFSRRFNELMRSRSCGGESHPLRGWGRTAPSGFSHSHPQGLRAVPFFKALCCCYPWGCRVHYLFFLGGVFAKIPQNGRPGRWEAAGALVLTKLVDRNRFGVGDNTLLFVICLYCRRK